MSPLHPSPSTCIRFVFKAWQLPKIKRTTCLECVPSPFPTLTREQSCPDSASYTAREQSKIVTTGITCRLLTGYYVPCFELPRKPLTFMEGILQQSLLQNSRSCEMSTTRVIPAARLCSYGGFMANLELPLTGPE